MRHVVQGIALEVGFGQEHRATPPHDVLEVVHQCRLVCGFQHVEYPADKHVGISGPRQPDTRPWRSHVAHQVADILEPRGFAPGPRHGMGGDIDAEDTREQRCESAGEAAVAAPDIHHRKAGVQVPLEGLAVAQQLVIGPGVPKHLPAVACRGNPGPVPVPGKGAVLGRRTGQRDEFGDHQILPQGGAHGTYRRGHCPNICPDGPPGPLRQPVARCVPLECTQSGAKGAGCQQTHHLSQPCHTPP